MIDENLVDVIEAKRVPIRMEGDPVLREVCTPVKEFNQDLTDLIETMLATMFANNGRGIAAPQIGVTKRVIVTVADNEITVMVNPTLMRTLNRETIEREGCLSVVPFKWRNVSRPAKCEVEYYTPSGERVVRNCTGELARVVQHELDHLNGILITDKPINVKKH